MDGCLVELTLKNHKMQSFNDFECCFHFRLLTPTRKIQEVLHGGEMLKLRKFGKLTDLARYVVTNNTIDLYITGLDDW